MTEKTSNGASKKGGKKESFNMEKYLINAFSMGWLSFPKYQWRGFGIGLALSGIIALLLSLSNVITFPQEYAAAIMVIGALISLLND
jgi:hypothetical protein